MSLIIYRNTERVSYTKWVILHTLTHHEMHPEYEVLIGGFFCFCLVCWLVGYLVGRLFGWLAGLMIGCLVGCLVGWLAG